MLHQPRELSRRLLYEKFGRGLESVVFDCGNGKEAEYIIRKGGDPVCVVALTDANEVILAKQFRYGPKRVLMELPGGGMDHEDETPLDAIRRELLEETGYAGDMQFVAQVFVDAYSPARRHCFVATNCKKIAEQQLDDTENIEVVLMSLEKFREHLRSGELSDVEAGYLGLDYLGLL